MYRRLAGLILAVFLLGCAALALRQRQLQWAHEITRTHGQIEATRRSIWMMQSLVAQQLQPERLRRDVEMKLAVVEPLRGEGLEPGSEAEGSRLAVGRGLVGDTP